MYVGGIFSPYTINRFSVSATYEHHSGPLGEIDYYKFINYKYIYILKKKKKK